MDTETVDVLAVGAGPGGLVAAMLARSRGLDTLVIEKSAARARPRHRSSASAAPRPNRSAGSGSQTTHRREAGQADSIGDGLRYLEHVVGLDGDLELGGVLWFPASPLMRDAVLENSIENGLIYIQSVLTAARGRLVQVTSCAGQQARGAFPPPGVIQQR